MPNPPDTDPPGPGCRPPHIVDQPRPGYFSARYVPGGPWVPARIQHEFGHWSVVIAGRPYRGDEDPHAAPLVLKTWHYGREVERAEYEEMLARPDQPNPFKPVDLTALPSIF